MKTFTKSFTGAYFFADKATFNLQHYPDNEAWKLGSAPRSKKDFFDLPVIRVAALEFDLKKFTPADGKMKAKVNKPVYFTYVMNGQEEITKVSLAIGERKKIKIKDMDFVFKGNTLSFSYKFDEEGSFPVTVIMNGKELLAYSVEVD